MDSTAKKLASDVLTVQLVLLHFIEVAEQVVQKASLSLAKVNFPSIFSHISDLLRAAKSAL